MPRSGKKSVGRQAEHRTSDVTLDDFANCKVSGGRLKKSTSNSFVREVKKCSTLEETLENQVIPDEEEEEEFAQLNKSKAIGKPCRSLKPFKESAYTGDDYPLDLWFILSEYISPEDIHIFASLCKSSLYVVRSYKFWICLYKRYYPGNASYLPESLSLQNIQRPRFLRVCVIRALHYLYPPFVKRVASTRWVDHQAYHLLKLRCIALWHTQAEGKWFFYFKFCTSAKLSVSTKKPAPVRKLHLDSWEGMPVDYGLVDQLTSVADVNANPEEGCCILKLVCHHYATFPPSVLGHRLADIKVNLTTDMRCHRVQLSFGSQSYHCRRRVNGLSNVYTSRGVLEVIEFSPVENLNVFHWWHPQYPLI